MISNQIATTIGLQLGIRKRLLPADAKEECQHGDVRLAAPVLERDGSGEVPAVMRSERPDGRKNEKDTTRYPFSYQNIICLSI
jgi:hypothetical protein